MFVPLAWVNLFSFFRASIRTFEICPMFGMKGGRKDNFFVVSEFEQLVHYHCRKKNIYIDHDSKTFDCECCMFWLPSRWTIIEFPRRLKRIGIFLVEEGFKYQFHSEMVVTYRWFYVTKPFVPSRVFTVWCSLILANIHYQTKRARNAFCLMF